jgi:hypothetical protein
MSDSTSEHSANPTDPASGAAPGEVELPHVEAPALSPAPSETTEAATADQAQSMGAAKLACGTALVLVHPQPQTQTAEQVADKPSASARFAPSFRSLAATLVGAAILGGVAGALATAGVLRGSPAPSYYAELAAALGRLDHELAQLKAGMNDKTSDGALAAITERLDRTEKAQLESGLKLARASEMVDRLERRFVTVPATPAAPPPANTQGDVTGSIGDPHGPNVAMSGDGRRIAPSPNATVPGTTLPFPALPVLEGWVLRDVYRGTALIQGRAGILQVVPGDNLPGLGRIESVQRRDGRWIVVTSRGLIVSRSSL